MAVATVLALILAAVPSPTAGMLSPETVVRVLRAAAPDAVTTMPRSAAREHLSHMSRLWSRSTVDARQLKIRAVLRY